MNSESFPHDSKDSSTDPRDVTRHLEDYAAGDPDALAKVLPLVYEELRRIARRQLYKFPDQRSLDTNALVHEVYIKLVDSGQRQWLDRGHFFAISARAMRQVLVDLFRQGRAQKRGSGEKAVTFLTGHGEERKLDEWIVSLDEALGELHEVDPDLVKLIELKFFMGMTEHEIAEAQDVSDRTVRRRWIRARAWLKEELES